MAAWETGEHSGLEQLRDARTTRARRAGLQRRGPHEPQVDVVLSRLERVRRSGGSWVARCPAHEDRSPSLSVREGCGRAGARLLPRGLPDRGRGRGDRAVDARPVRPDARSVSDERVRGAQPGAGGGVSWPRTEVQRRNTPLRRCTTAETGKTPLPLRGGADLEAYAAGKNLDPAFLRGLGLRDVYINGAPTLQIPYLDVHGDEVATRFRHWLDRGGRAQVHLAHAVQRRNRTVRSDSATPERPGSCFSSRASRTRTRSGSTASRRWESPAPGLERGARRTPARRDRAGLRGDRARQRRRGRARAGSSAPRSATACGS